eukprot:scaffold743_cov117-Cylindrotheca_fusiformis.AAC.7
MLNSALSLLFLLLLFRKALSQIQLSDEERLELWARGAFNLDVGMNPKNLLSSLNPLKLGPVSKVRREALQHRNSPNCDSNGYCWNQFRGGAQSTLDFNEQMNSKIQELGSKYGSDFMNAIEKNKQDHNEDCKKSCEIYYCADKDTPLAPLQELMGSTTIKSYSMGPVPPEDFVMLYPDEIVAKPCPDRPTASGEYSVSSTITLLRSTTRVLIISTHRFPLDIIKVTETQPLFSASEAMQVVSTAEAEGVDENEFKSGKYKLAGDWLDNLPNTRAWFNQQLESTFFPLLAHLFPEVVSSASVIRAHSVSLLKYNSSHPRTDVHIDNGILAMTIAMTPSKDYSGGGTYFEHMGNDNILAMDVGHATLRPGSVRHGGHRVTDGTRYILGAFLLLEDRVEHVRRLKNRGSELRRVPDLEGAAKHFEWALALNPKCTTCLKDWAEILHTQKRFDEAEMKIRSALELLEYKDSDALFTLGVLLSEQGRDEESIEAYKQSIELNAEDAELCYNLGIKLGAKGMVKDEMKMYAKATKADPSFGGAWLNWGTVLAESGNTDDAELMFMKAMQCEAEVAPKAMMNLSLVYIARGNALAQSGDLQGAMKVALDAARYMDEGKELLDVVASSGNADGMIDRFIQQFRPLRLQAYRLIGQLHAGAGDMTSCEDEFRKATERFPDDLTAWKLLERILQVQGKQSDLAAVAAKIRSFGF